MSENDDAEIIADKDLVDEMISDINVITLFYDMSSSTEPPQIDLGNASPWFAHALFQQAMEAIEMTFPYPRIICRGDVIFDPTPHECGPECED